MDTWKDKCRIIALGMSISAGLLAASAPGYATEQAQQRREGRDVKQDTRQQAREEKVDCRAANQKSNAACRQDKRDTKQGGRQQARDIKY
jgi:uncharacterized membrane protein